MSTQLIKPAVSGVVSETGKRPDEVDAVFPGEEVVFMIVWVDRWTKRPLHWLQRAAGKDQRHFDKGRSTVFNLCFSHAGRRSAGLFWVTNPDISKECDFAFSRFF